MRLRLGACFGFSGSLDFLDRFEELALKFRPVSIVQPCLYISSVSGLKPLYVSLPIWLFLGAEVANGMIEVPHSE